MNYGKALDCIPEIEKGPLFSDMEVFCALFVSFDGSHRLLMRGHFYLSEECVVPTAFRWWVISAVL